MATFLCRMDSTDTLDTHRAGSDVVMATVAEVYLSPAELRRLIDTLIEYEQEILHAEALGTHQPG